MDALTPLTPHAVHHRSSSVGSVTASAPASVPASAQGEGATVDPSSVEPRDAYSGSVPHASLAPHSHHNAPGPVEEANPVVGHREAAPDLVAGDLKSPRFLGTEAEYFKEAHRLIADAKPGDMLALQMYEFENAATNGDTNAAKAAPGYADQQALLPGLADAAARGVKVHIVLDASRNPETHDYANGPVARQLQEAGEKSGNITLDYYPPSTVNIDHAKELIHMTPARDGKYAVQEALVGGSNWGNHTPANDDGGGAFYGKDALGAAEIFYRDQAFCRGDRTAPANPAENLGGPVRWATTSPVAEGGGSTGIRDAKLDMTRKADEVYLNEFCLTHEPLVEATAEKGGHAHARLDPNEKIVNQKALAALRAAGGEAMWANTEMDPGMVGQKEHEKLDVYVTDGVATGATIGSANDTANGLESTHQAINHSTGNAETRKTNHEIDAVVTRYTDGDYSTAPFLDAALAKSMRDLRERSLQYPPSHGSGTKPGQF